MTDNVNHPSHYADGWSNGAEVIDITENLNFNRGNAVKYIARAGKKDASKELEDLQKAEFYLKREIARLKDDNIIDAEAVEPHYSWQYLNDECIPPGVYQVYDRNGDEWQSFFGRKEWRRVKDAKSTSEVSAYDVSPFTEVIS